MPIQRQHVVSQVVLRGWTENGMLRAINLRYGLANSRSPRAEGYVPWYVDSDDSHVIENLWKEVEDVTPAALASARVPLQGHAAAWVERTLRLVRQGRLVLFDYAGPTTAQLAAMPWRDWLHTYRGHERGRHYLADPGEQDITAEVALDQLPAPDALRTQAQWLGRGRQRPRTSTPCGCAAEWPRPRRCSTRPASVPSSSPNGAHDPFWPSGSAGCGRS